MVLAERRTAATHRMSLMRTHPAVAGVVSGELVAAALVPMGVASAQHSAAAMMRAVGSESDREHGTGHQSANGQATSPRAPGRT